MSITSSFDDAPHFPIADVLTAQLRRVPRFIWVLALAAGAFLGAQQVAAALQTPGQTIRSELAAGAAEVKALASFRPTAGDRQAIERHFRGHAVTVDTTRLWPQVKVTFHGLDRNTCLDAQAVARRMEGLTVVDLQGYRTPADCAELNDMAWWIMP